MTYAVLCAVCSHHMNRIAGSGIHSQSQTLKIYTQQANLIKFNDGNKKGPTNTNRHYSHHSNVYESCAVLYSMLYTRSTVIEYGEGRFLTQSFICWLITLYLCRPNEITLTRYTHTIAFICFVWVSSHLLVLCWSTVVFSNFFSQIFVRKFILLL